MSWTARSESRKDRGSVIYRSLRDRLGYAEAEHPRTSAPVMAALVSASPPRLAASTTACSKLGAVIAAQKATCRAVITYPICRCTGSSRSSAVRVSAAAAACPTCELDEGGRRSCRSAAMVRLNSAQASPASSSWWVSDESSRETRSMAPVSPR
jgi:hypothetical protein